IVLRAKPRPRSWAAVTIPCCRPAISASHLSSGAPLFGIAEQKRPGRRRRPPRRRISEADRGTSALSLASVPEVRIRAVTFDFWNTIAYEPPGTMSEARRQAVPGAGEQGGAEGEA